MKILVPDDTPSPTKLFVLYGLFILIIYWVGAVALATHNIAVLALTPFNMLMTLLVLNCMYVPSLKLYLAQIIVFMLGYFIEVIGVRTGLLFGSYIYMDNLGIKVWETPLVMGINWIVTVFCSASIVNSFHLRSLVTKAVAAASFMVLLDLFLEPICAAAGFWSWEERSAPLQNYIAWFVLGAFIQYGLFASKVNLNNPMAYLLYILQILFFILAYIYL